MWSFLFFIVMAHFMFNLNSMNGLLKFVILIFFFLYFFFLKNFVFVYF